MKKWTRVMYQPNRPLKEGCYVTASKEHIALSREAAAEGMVLLKNEHNLLPLKAGSRIALFGKGSFDYVKEHQIHQLRGKGQNVRKPQQRHKKRHAHHRHQQGLFRVRSHPNVPFPERLRGFFFVLYPEKISLSSSRGAAQHALYSRPRSFRLKSARHHAMAMPPAMPSAARKVCSPKCSAAGRSLETTAFMQ